MILDLLRDSRIFPSIMLALSLLAAGRYAIAGQYGQAFYWVAASAITFSVTFLQGWTR